jgi:hypothetical protein
VPGLGLLNAGGNAQVDSVSCGSAGNCAGSGFYTDGSGHVQAFVVNERHGSWGGAFEVPGSATLNAGGNAKVDSISCTSAGNCAAGGSYTDGSRHLQAFVVAEQDGYWDTAQEVPGSAVLNARGIAEVDSISCTFAGDCAAAGAYSDGSGSLQAFVVSQRAGSWGKATEVPGSGVLNAGGSAEVHSVSCASAGNCAAGGDYIDGSGHRQAFVVSQRAGSWGKATEVPGSAALNAGGNARVFSVSCASAGNCVAGGYYADGSGAFQAFVVTERRGTWLRAIEVPGSGALNVGGDAQVSSVSCTRTGSCAAGGQYQGGSGLQGFVVNNNHG